MQVIHFLSSLWLLSSFQLSIIKPKPMCNYSQQEQTKLWTNQILVQIQVFDVKEAKPKQNVNYHENLMTLYQSTLFLYIVWNKMNLNLWHSIENHSISYRPAVTFLFQATAVHCKCSCCIPILPSCLSPLSFQGSPTCCFRSSYHLLSIVYFVFFPFCIIFHYLQYFLLAEPTR